MKKKLKVRKSAIVLGSLGLIVAAGMITRSSVNADGPEDALATTSSTSQQIREFIRAQKAELKDADHQNKLELKELKTTQETHRKNWIKAETNARHEFFANHPKGQDRRPYIQDFLKRKAELLASFVDEKRARVAEQEEKMKVLKQTQVINLQKFTESVERGGVPSPDLWPKSN